MMNPRAIAMAEIKKGSLFPNSKIKEITQRWHLEQSEQREIPF